MKNLTVCALLFFWSGILNAQNVGIGTASPDASAKMDITATNAGLLIPRVSLTGTNDVTTIPAPANSLLVYNQANAGSGNLAVTSGFYFYSSASASWTPLSTANSSNSSWLLGGNSGTSSATNYIGSSDNQSLLFKINNTEAGFLGVNGNSFWGLSGNRNSSTGANNTAIGSGSLMNISTGYSNVAIGTGALNKNNKINNIVAVGDSALYKNGTGAVSPNQGINNTAVGSKTLYNNTIGLANSAFGFNTLFSNSVGYYNTAIGSEALFYNVGGNSNTAIGYKTLNFNNSGNRNVAVGLNSLRNNLGGSDNSALGTSALELNTNGTNNIAIGNAALHQNQVGSYNIAIGDSSMFNSPEGNNVAIGTKTLYAHQIGQSNTAVGSNALSADVTGYGNTAIGTGTMQNNNSGAYNSSLGISSMAANISGTSNVAIGSLAFYNNQSGNKNVAIGAFSMTSNVSGYSNTVIGYGSNVIFPGAYNRTAIGYAASSDCNNCLVLGSTNDVDIDGQFTAAVNVGIGTQHPITKLHISPDGPGSILLGNSKNFGSFTSLEMGISADKNGFSYLQSTKSAGSAWGNLLLNPYSGFVGINHSDGATVQYPLDINETNKSMGLRLRNRLSGTADWDLNADAGINFNFNTALKAWIDINGAYHQISDARLKKNIETMPTVLQNIMQLSPKKYDYIQDAKTSQKSIGFIAQEVNTIFPELVDINKSINKDSSNTEKYMGINYSGFSVLAIKAIQEQQQIIEAQNKRIEKLEIQVNAILNEKK